MASLERDTASGNFRIRFRLGNRPFKRTLKTTSQREAEAILTRLEENLRLLERGRLELPPGADPGAFLLSDGKLTGKPTAPKALTLAELYAVYEEKTPAGSKEKNSASTEKSHWKHLTHILGGKVVAQSLTTADIQRYVQQHRRIPSRGSPSLQGRSGRKPPLCGPSGIGQSFTACSSVPARPVASSTPRLNRRRRSKPSRRSREPLTEAG